MTRDEGWWLYVLECRGGVLYTGIARDVDARFKAHVDGRGAKFTRWKQPLRIVARTSFPTKGEALRAEHALKQATRAEKLRWCAAGLDRFAAGLGGPGRRRKARRWGRGSC